MSETGPVTVVQRLLPDSDAPRLARDAASGVLQRLRCGGERADDLALVVSELVTNAVVHGPEADLELTITATRTLIRVEVGDSGTTNFDWPQQPGDGHWGLGLVGIFSDRAGVTRQPCTVVWCELDLDGARSR